MGKLEIKCPHCIQWTLWEGSLQDRCRQCGKLLQEEKINKLEVLEKLRKAKEEIENARIARQHPFLRRISGYAKSVFIGFILIIIAIIVLHTG